MPPIPAAHMAMVLRAVVALFVFGLGMTAVSVVGFPNDYYSGRVHPPLPPLDYYGGPIDVQQLLHDAPTPTLPLHISYAAPFNILLKSTPTTVPTPHAVLFPASTTDAPASTPFLAHVIPPPGASKLELLLIWWQNLFRYIIKIVCSTSVPSSRATLWQAWGIACRIAYRIPWVISATATVNFFRHRLNFRKFNWTSVKGIGKAVTSKANAQLATGTNATQNALAGMFTGIILERHQDPATMMSAMHRLLVAQYGNACTLKIMSEEGEARQPEVVKGPSNVQADLEKRRVFDMANTHIKETLAKEKAHLNRIANQEFRRLRRVHEDKLNATYEQDVFATANIEPSFGPSLRNAEVELRCRLGKVGINEGLREDITSIFKGVLYSFTYAMAVEESRPEGRNTRYLAVIDGQNDLIESLRLLHEHRERAYAENEELVRSLCLYNVKGELALPDDSNGMYPWDKYSPKDDKFILSPLDGPIALSMKFSVSSAPFRGRPDADLNSEPHWQKFLESIAEKSAEQEVRHVSNGKYRNADEREGESGINDSSVEEPYNVLQDDNEELPNEDEASEKSGIKDASEQNHHVVAQSYDDISFDKTEVKSKSGIRDTSEEIHHDGSQSSDVDPKDDEIEEDTDIKDASEQDDHGPTDRPSSPSEERDAHNDHLAEPDLPPASTTEDTGDALLARALEVQEQEYELLNAKDELQWHEWQIAYLKDGYGTPEDPYAKPSEDICAEPIAPPASTSITEESSDAAIARRFHEVELVVWRADRIRRFEDGAAILTAQVANLDAILRGGAPMTKTQKRVLERKRAKAKRAEEAEQPR
ncbi:hypothetical protein HO133_005275 [Letharia lupina]|uniref:Uncharacterized protein n=1 Tax=Letharia lupina TaxID=560253 RepID=A0A8H6F8K2_9LECA|nr:uncharacterized protein HO133_005275 [Letharia lupina]KAF6218733.1 hypothetical protein HO133_005275 [Letharia lupina]